MKRTKKMDERQSDEGGLVGWERWMLSRGIDCSLHALYPYSPMIVYSGLLSFAYINTFP